MLFQAAMAAPRLADFMPRLSAADVFPGADRLGPVEGSPPVARAYAGDELLGYVYITTDVVNTRGYSSFPIDTLVALSNDGTIVGARLMEHHEPIVLIGIPESRVEDFINGYIGLNYIKAPPEPGAPPPVDIISGATVTLLVVGDSITRSAMAIARFYRIGEPPGQAAAVDAPREKRQVNPDKQETATWEQLLDNGAVARMHITVGQVNQTFAESGRQAAAGRPQAGDPDETFIDLYTALVSVPSIGRSLLGDVEYDYLRQRLRPGQQAILVAGNGIYSFKGSGYVRGGIFDRIEVVQDLDSFHFTDMDHERLADVMADGAPRFKEIALFTVPASAAFDPIEPWRLQLMVQRVISVTDKAFINYNLNYALPNDYTLAVEPPSPAATPAGPPPPEAEDEAGRRAAIEAEIAASPALWKQIWAAKTGQVAIVAAALLLLAGVFFFQDTLARHETFYKRFRIAYLTFSLFWLGWYASAQLSVVNVLTFTSAVTTDFRWEYFLMDPIVFILWVATAISLVFWNRGAFCGWLCPFGALQELTNKLARLLHVPQLKIPHGVSTRLASLKYVIFLLLFGVLFYDMALAEKLAEVEPFKTAIILKFIRDWPFVVFAVLLVIAGLFIERFYCRYLCPLGAALAIPARLRIFDWLRRYRTCGNPCQRCAVECPVQAIAPEGDINPNECIQCLNCQMLYHHEQKCPHLLQKNARRRRKEPPPVEIDTTVVARTPTVRPRET
ncbi:regulatory protein NosR [Alcaligenaceae bacterium]|nr:regulatory protein NosR [Alcaligenaceae bacterium]